MYRFFIHVKVKLHNIDIICGFCNSNKFININVKFGSSLPEGRHDLPVREIWSYSNKFMEKVKKTYFVFNLH